MTGVGAEIPLQDMTDKTMLFDRRLFFHKDPEPVFA